MLGFWIALIWLIGVSLSPASAELYRWTDDAGTTHLTDNPDTIPSAYRTRARASGTAPATTSEEDEATTSSQVPAPQSVPPSSPDERPQSPVTSPTGSALASEMTDLRQQILTARQERQTYFERLSSARSGQTTPVFVRQRREIADMGQALLQVEQRLDMLQAALAEAQKQRRAPQTLTSSQLQSPVDFDQDGHDAAYWQRRVASVREQGQQAREQRRALLARLTVTAGGESRSVERRGREVLQQARTLEQLAGEIDAAEAALERMRDEARRAGAPAEWLE